MVENNVNKFQTLGRVKTVNGSVLNPEMAGLRFVLSVNNLAGKAEGNPLLPLFDKKWKKVREESRGWFVNQTGAYKVGVINPLAVNSDIWVIQMLAQGKDLKTDLIGLEGCLKEVCKLAHSEKASVHISSILTDAIPELSDLSKKLLVEQGVSVHFYNETV